MRLMTLETALFGTLHLRYPLQFAPGINIIIAPNQAGKSTLLTLIEWALYGVPPHNAGKRSLGMLEDWSPWTGDKPRAVLTLQPGNQNWPGLVRLDAHFASYKPYLSNLETLEDLSHLLHVSKNGTWDLGSILLGLRREAYRGSLYAPQGELEQVLTDVELRKVLTADLAELVEDPERATLDAALSELEKPSFTCEVLAATPLQLPNLLHRAEDDYKRRRAERERLEAKYGELEEALAERETAEQKLLGLRTELATLDDQRLQHDLAAAHWRYSQVHQLKQSLSVWENRFTEAPFLVKFPYDIEGAVQRWRGELSQHSDAVARQRAKLEQLRFRHAGLEEQLKRDEQLIALAEYLPQLTELATAIDLGIKEKSTADWKVKDYGEGSDALTRTRFEALEERVKPYRDVLPRLLEWIDAKAAAEAEASKLQARYEALVPIARKHQPLFIGIAIVLMIGAVAAGVIGPLMDSTAYGIAAALVLLAGGVGLLVSEFKRRRATDKAQLEINQVVKPAMEKVANSQKSLGYSQVELQAQFNIKDEAWQQLMHDLPEYGQLNLRLRNYADACRDSEQAAAKIEKAWGSVRYIMPDTPARPDLAWLTTAMAKLDQAHKRVAERLDLMAAIKDGERELIHLERREAEEFLPRLSRILEPVGLAERVYTDYESAIRQCETYARDARAYQDQLALLATAEDRARSIPLALEEYERRISELNTQQLQQLGKLIHDEDSFRRAATERRSLHEKAIELRQQLDKSQVSAGRFRERIAKDEESLLALPEAQEQETAAAARLDLIRRWERALNLLKHSLRDLQNDLASSLAPRINEELKFILRQAPVPNVDAAALGEHLDMRLRLHGAPAGLTAQEALARLSLGAKRQLALALRAAVARALGAERNTPLLLDEPLAELDDDRAVDCLSFLEHLSHEHQILLTTCHQAQYRFLLERSGIAANIMNLD